MRPSGRSGREPYGGLLRRKPIPSDEAEPEPGAERGGPALTRSLGLWQLTAIGIGGIIGAGIFSLAGAVANKTTGPSVVISFLVAGVASAAAPLAYAEFAGWSRSPAQPAQPSATAAQPSAAAAAARTAVTSRAKWTSQPRSPAVSAPRALTAAWTESVTGGTDAQPGVP